MFIVGKEYRKKSSYQVSKYQNGINMIFLRNVQNWLTQKTCKDIIIGLKPKQSLGRLKFS